MTTYDHNKDNIFDAIGITDDNIKKEILKEVIDFVDSLFEEMIISQPISVLAERYEQLFEDVSKKGYPDNIFTLLTAMITRYLMASCTKAAKDMWDIEEINQEMEKSFKALKTGTPNNIDD